MTFNEAHCLNFLIFGIVLGALIPLLGIGFAEHYQYIDVVSNNLFWLCTACFCFVVFSFIFTLAAILFSQKWCLYVGGIISIFLISFIVHQTGGITNSLMSFYFIFIPSVVAVSFDINEGESGIGIWGTSSLCFLCVLALFFIDKYDHIPTVADDTNHILYKNYKFCCFTLIIFQILLVLS